MTTQLRRLILSVINQDACYDCVVSLNRWWQILIERPAPENFIEEVFLLLALLFAVVQQILIVIRLLCDNFDLRLRFCDLLLNIFKWILAIDLVDKRLILLLPCILLNKTFNVVFALSAEYLLLLCLVDDLQDPLREVPVIPSLRLLLVNLPKIDSSQFRLITLKRGLLLQTGLHHDLPLPLLVLDV